MDLNIEKVDLSRLMHELEFTFSRSSGPGGQHANKVSTRVQLKWDVAGSQLLNNNQKSFLLQKLAGHLTQDGVLTLSSDKFRSQSSNRDEVINKLEVLLKKAFTFTRPRRPTKPTVASHKKRLNQKKQLSEKKQWRKKLKPGRE